MPTIDMLNGVVMLPMVFTKPSSSLGREIEKKKNGEHIATAIVAGLNNPFLMLIYFLSPVKT